MRYLLAVLLAVMVTACTAAPIQNLRLAWLGVGAPRRPTPAVSEALAYVPLAITVRDVRSDPYGVGFHEKEGVAVRTSDNVAEYVAARIGDQLRLAGARFEQPPGAILDIELVEFRVNEAGRFNGLAVLRVNVRTGGDAGWSRTYQGTSHRWGRTHSPANFNEALSNALAEAIGQMLADQSFGEALMAGAGRQPSMGSPPGY